MAAVDVLRSALLGATGVDEGGGLTRRKGLFHFGPCHHLELYERLPGGARGPGHGGHRRGAAGRGRLREDRRDREERDDGEETQTESGCGGSHTTPPAH